MDNVEVSPGSSPEKSEVSVNDINASIDQAHEALLDSAVRNGWAETKFDDEGNKSYHLRSDESPRPYSSLGLSENPPYRLTVTLPDKRRLTISGEYTQKAKRPGEDSFRASPALNLSNEWGPVIDIASKKNLPLWAGHKRRSTSKS